MIAFACPKCGTKQRVETPVAGQKLPCVMCGRRLQVTAKPWGSGQLVPKKSEVRKLLENNAILSALIGAAVLLLVGFFVWKSTKAIDVPRQEEVAQPVITPEIKPLDPKEIYDRCSHSVARVVNHRSTGSGFLARPNIVVTNAHVVKNDFADHLQVTFPSSVGGGNPIKATLLYVDRKRDLAIVRAETSLKPLPLADRECPPGEKVVVIGSPGKTPGAVVENSITDGLMSARTQLGDNQDWYQFTAQINPGNSGGPVFNNRGQVAGVVTLFLKNKQGMNYAVPHGEVSKALDRALAQDQRQLDEVIAEHDLTVAFGRIGKSAWLYNYGVRFYYGAMKAAVEKGRKPDEGIKIASERIDEGIGRGSDRFFDAECRASLPRLISNKALPDATRQQMEELIALHTEMKSYFDRPRGTVAEYGQKSAECAEKLDRVFESLRLKLGVSEDPQLTPEEKEDLRLP